MIERLIVDCSVALAWVVPAQASSECEQWLSEVESGCELLVPSLWPMEVANSLLTLERRKRITREDRTRALQGLARLHPRVEECGMSVVFEKVSELAEAHGLSVYDAVYLELATRMGVPLATRDEALRAAARKCGVAAKDSA